MEIDDKEQKNIDELKSQCQRLLALLEKPEPGIITWRLLVAKLIREIGDWL